MNQEYIYDLFVSYAEADRAWVEGYLLDALSQDNIKILSESSFRLGVPRINEFQRAIQQSRRTLLVISQAYLAEDFSEFVELLGQSYGQNNQTWPVIPLILEQTILPPRLAMLVELNARTTEEQLIAINRLCEDLQYSLPQSVNYPSCPYPGMVAFQESEKERFFGRDKETKELIERLRSHPFIAVIGSSGSGKSSLVFAGLIPKLKTSRLFGDGNWLFLSMRPGKYPLQTLKKLLNSDLTNLHETIENLLSNEPKYQRILLIVDQLEELFTQQGEGLESFQKIILQLTDVPSLYIIFTVRADFYADLMNSFLWSLIQPSRLEILPLDETGLRQAIIHPAEALGVFIEPALVEKLVDDSVGEPGVLPLLQETLVLLWEKLERHFLPLRAYEALVLTRDSFGKTNNQHKTGLQIAISRRADAALASLKINAEKQRNIARRIFIRLIQFGEGRPDTRRQQLVSDLQINTEENILFTKTLENLIDCRLLTSSQDEKDISVKKVDIAHEALITGWSTLQKWLLEYREVELNRRRLMEKAKEWERLGKKSGGLLDEIEIAEAERWLSNAQTIDLSYDQLINQFLAVSKTQIDKSHKMKKMIIAIISFLAMLAVGGVGFAWKQQSEFTGMQTIVDLQLGNIKPKTLEALTPILTFYLQKAEEANKKVNDYKNSNISEDLLFEQQEEAIRNSRAVLDLIFRIEGGNLNVEYLIKKELIKEKAENIMDKNIIDYGVKKIEDKLRNNKIGNVKPTTYLQYDQKFTTDSALKATYDVIMLDLGADVDRMGTLTPKEVYRIPCELLDTIDKLWRKYTNNECGWSVSTSYLTGGKCIKNRNETLTTLIFPANSYEHIEKYMNACRQSREFSKDSRPRPQVESNQCVPILSDSKFQNEYKVVNGSGKITNSNYSNILAPGFGSDWSISSGAYNSEKKQIMLLIQGRYISLSLQEELIDNKPIKFTIERCEKEDNRTMMNKFVGGPEFTFGQPSIAEGTLIKNNNKIDAEFVIQAKFYLTTNSDYPQLNSNQPYQGIVGGKFTLDLKPSKTN